jgi:hypothetical protein
MTRYGADFLHRAEHHNKYLALIAMIKERAALLDRTIRLPRSAARGWKGAPQSRCTPGTARPQSRACPQLSKITLATR